MKNNSREFSTNAKRRKFKSSLVFILSIIMIVGLLPTYLAKATDNNIKLGDISHYNAIMFGDFTPIHAETEGAIGIQGNVNISETYTIGGVNQNHTGWSIGNGYIDNNGPTLLLGGDILGKVPTIMTKGNKEDLVVSNTSNVDKKIPETQIPYTKLNKDIIDNAFKKLQNQVEEFMIKAESFKPSTKLVGGDLDSAFKFVESNENSRVLVNSINRNVDYLNITESFNVPDLSNIDFVIIYSNATKINFNSDLKYNGVTVDGDNQIYSNTPDNSPMKITSSKIMYVFPRAQEIINTGNNALKGSIFAPNATLKISAKAVNGQMFLKNAIQENGGEIHNFKLNWDKWNSTNPPNPPEEKSKVKLTKVDGDLKAITSDTAEFRLYKDGKEIDSNKIYKTKDGIIEEINLGIGSYYFEEVKVPNGYEKFGDGKFKFEINKDNLGKTIEISAKNLKKQDPPNPPEEKSKVKLTKVDGDLKTITSDTAEFRLYKDGKEIDSNKIYKTKDGIIEEINLGIGSYYFEEVKVPNGYEKFGDSKFKFEINKDNLGKTIEISAKNLKKQDPPNPPEEKSKVQLTKVDGDLKVITSDTAEFRLYKDGKEIDSNKIYKTKDGIIEEINLGIGSYYFEEVKVPNGYEKFGDGKFKFEINKDNLGKTIEISAKNLKKQDPPNPPEEKSKVKLTKVDGDLKAITSDTAEFRLYKDGKEIDSNKIYKTKDGIIEEINLGIGSYYFEEVKVPNGYEKFGDSKFKFEINKDNLGKTIEISAKNLKKQDPPNPPEEKSKVKLTKVDGDLKIITSDTAEFRLYKDGKEIDSNKIYKTKDGIIEEINLGIGSYYFEEVKVPNGYEKFGDSKFKFEINKDNLGKTIEISAKNLKKQEPPTPSEKLGSIGDTVWIDKNENGIQDKDEFLADKVKVILYKEDGKTKIADMYTANGGKYLFDKLPLGSYRVKFELPEGYKFTKIGSIDKDLDSDADADDTGMTQIITLDDKNNQRLTIDAGIIKLEQKNPIKEVIKAVLPKTGEAFTSFALAGALLVLAGAIVLIVRKYKK